MKSVLGCLAVIAGTAVAFAGPQISSPLSVDAASSTAVMTALTLDEAGYQALRQAGSVTLNDFVLAPGATVALELTQRDAYATNARLFNVTDQGEVEMPRPEVTLFGGKVLGEEDSTVFLAFSPYGVEGFIESMGQTWIVSSGPFDQDLPIGIYNLTTLPDGVINWAQWECAAGQLAENVRPIDPQQHGAARGAECFHIEWAVETDQEFLGLFGGDQTAANTYIATLFGAVGEIYMRDFNAEVEVTWSRLWTSADPWTQGSSTDQLYQFQEYWEANMEGVARDLTHFLSGRGLGGGVAWLPGVCDDTYNYGLSGNLSGFVPYPIQDNNAQNWDLMVVAHEGGHNVGAPHTHDHGVDNCAGGDCSVTPFGTIMSYCHLCPGGLANVLMQFHPDSINIYILPTMSGAACVAGSCEGLDFDFPNGLPTLVSPAGTTTVDVVVTGVGSVAPIPGSGMIHYQTSNGSGSAAMNQISPNVYEATIPASDCGSIVSYSFSAQGSDAQTYNDPSNGEYEATAAEGINIAFADDCEIDLGWTVSNTATDGQWNRGVPVDCGRGDPSADFDGSGQAYLTDNSAASQCNSDVDNGSTTLTSPVLDASVAGAHIAYARWFSNTQGGAPNEDIFVVEVSNDNGTNWTNLETVGPTGSEANGGWYYKTFRIADVFATPSNQFRIRFVAYDINSGSVVEAGVDAIQIFAYDCGAECAADRNADGQLNFFDVQDFLNDFAAQDASADLNNDGQWNFFDAQTYLGLFAAGCP